MKDPRAYALLRGVLGDPRARDVQGRLIDFYALDLLSGDLVFVCAEDGTPEIEVRVAHDQTGRPVGILTGRQRSCRVEPS